MGNNDIKIGTKYKHFKGNEYLVINIAKHSETLEEMVVYQSLDNEKNVWVRPLSMFGDYIDIKGDIVRRFKEIE